MHRLCVSIIIHIGNSYFKLSVCWVQCTASWIILDHPLHWGRRRGKWCCMTPLFVNITQVLYVYKNGTVITIMKVKNQLTLVVDPLGGDGFRVPECLLTCVAVGGVSDTFFCRASNLELLILLLFTVTAGGDAGWRVHSNNTYSMRPKKLPIWFTIFETETG